MHEFEIDDIIYVGGCCGKAVSITDTEIVVAGRYYYYDVAMEANPDLRIWEDWQFRYSISDFAKAEWDEERKEWRAEKIQPIYDSSAIATNEEEAENA